MDLNWNDREIDILVENLRKKEHIYNSNHPNFKIFNQIDECAIIGQKFKPPRTGDEVMNKITTIKNDLQNSKILIEEGFANFSNLPFGKFRFMYTSLFGEPLAESLKRKYNKESKSEQEKLKKKAKTTQNVLFSGEKEDYESIDFCEETNEPIDYQTKIEKYDHKKSEIQIRTNTGKKRDLLRLIIDFIRDKPFIWDSDHPTYHNAAYKRQILENFGNSLNPQVAVNLIQYRISYLKKKFCKEIRQKTSTWHLLNDCKFLLKSGNELELAVNNEEMDRNAIMYKIIQFVKDKPYLYNKNHPQYNDQHLKKKVLSEFAQCLQMTVSHLNFRLKYLKKTFFKCLNKVDGSPPWRWFNDCKFFLGGVDNKTLNRAERSTNSIKTDWPFIINIEQFVKFLQLEPVMYNTKAADFFNVNKKYELCSKYRRIFFPHISVNDIAKHVKFIRKKIFITLNNGNIEKKKWAHFNKFQFMHEAVKDYQSSNFNDLDFDDLKEVNKDIVYNMKDSFISESNARMKFEKQSKFFILDEIKYKNYQQNLNEDVKEVGVQCNLYEEIFKKQIKNMESKTCSCLEEILQIMKEFKPMDDNLTIFENSEQVFHSSEEIFVDKYEIVDYNKTKCNENFTYNMNEKSIDDGCDWEYLEDNSTDSSNYGLTELPFPEKAKESKNKIDQSYVCHICSKIFSKNYFLQKHYTNFHSQRSVLCSICGKINKSFRKMQMHENNCNPNENRYCYECKKIFKSKIIFNDHLNCVHNSKNLYMCCCGRSFMKYTKFVLHLNKYQCGTLDSCTLPDYVTKEFLKTFIELKDHTQDAYVVEDNAKQQLKFWCRICKINYYNNRAYMSHFEKELHMDSEKHWIKEFKIERPFECEFCNYNKAVFENISELVKHRNKIHHKCTLAEYFEKFEFTTDINILLKEPTDYSKINSTCHICKKIFLMNNYEEHFESQEHKIIEKKWLEKHSITEFTCNMCLRTDKTLLQFLKHRKFEHNQWPINRLLKNIEGIMEEIVPEYVSNQINSKLIYKCSICNFYCCSKRTYINHMLVHLPEKLIQCSCGEKFITCNKMEFHRKRKGCSKEGCLIPQFILEASSTINPNLKTSNSEGNKK